MEKRYSKKELMTLLKIDDATFKQNLTDGFYSQHGTARGTYYLLTKKHTDQAINSIRCQPPCDGCKCDKAGYAIKDNVAIEPKKRWWWKFYR